MITDHYMPGSYSGLSLARVIRTKRLETQLVVMSGRMTPELCDEYAPFGVMGFMAKPIDLDELRGFLQLLVMV